MHHNKVNIAFLLQCIRYTVDFLFPFPKILKDFINHGVKSVNSSTKKKLMIFSDCITCHFIKIFAQFLSFSQSVMLNSLRPHDRKHASLPCPSLSPRVCSNSCPLSWWYHPTSSSSVTCFSSCPRSFQAAGSFPVNWLFTLGGQSIGAWASASASVFPMYMQNHVLMHIYGI